MFRRTRLIGQHRLESELVRQDLLRLEDEGGIESSDRAGL
jgi:hypothetical protein